MANDQVIARSLRTYGEWAEHEIEVLSMFIRPGTVVLDIGSNIGTHVLAFAKRFPDVRVVGFEPQPIIYEIATANIRLNGLSNASVIQYACCKDHRYFELSPPDEQDGNPGARCLVDADRLSTIRAMWGASSFRTKLLVPRRTQQVRGGPVDSLKFAGQVSLVKIDVEGMELDVLEGARSTLRQHSPVVYFEVLTTTGLAPILEILQSVHYRSYWLETHQFNRSNRNLHPHSIWARTEMGILALPREMPLRKIALPPVDSIPPELPSRFDPHYGIDVAELSVSLQRDVS